MWHAAGVAAFDRATDRDRVDYQLMVRSPVRLVHDRAVLDDTVGWLRRHGYHVVSVDASWLITSHMFRDLAAALGTVCHDQWHCLGEGFAAAVADGWDRFTGFALVLVGFDGFARHQRDDARRLLDLVAEHAWSAAVLGGRVLCLAQTDDPDLRPGPVAVSAVWWTDADWGRASRPPRGR